MDLQTLVDDERLPLAMRLGIAVGMKLRITSLPAYSEDCLKDCLKELRAGSLSLTGATDRMVENIKAGGA